MVRPNYSLLSQTLAVVLSAADVCSGALLPRAGECTFWRSAWDGQTCVELASAWGITEAMFISYNPGVSCPTLVIDQSYCVEWFGELPPGPSTTKAAVPTTTKQTVTTTAPGNGVQTPEPFQPGMVRNCDKFHLIKSTTTCESIRDYFGISLNDFVKWNPGVSDIGCSAMIAGTWACVGVIGGTTPGSPTTTTTSLPANGIETPSPIQTGMVGNCNKFHLVKSTTTCASLQDYFSISWADLYKWNSGIGSQCQSLWANTYVCVGVVGGAATTTKPSNGIETPSPIQQGMVGNCNKFHLIKPTTSCQSLQDYFQISLADLVKFNPAIKTDCSNLWTDTWACVGVVGGSGGTPTTTAGGGGIVTPTPTQAGMIKGCTQFHLIKSTTTCASIQDYFKISLADFVRWNPAIGSSCTSLWANTYACVAGPGGTQPGGGNGGVATPTPIQAGMIKGCKEFHFIKSTTTCASIQNYYKITLASFVKWNPAIKSDCSNLWANTYACVAGP